MEVDLQRIEDRLPYVFSDKNLLLEALCHASFVNERPEEKALKDNQRMEFLGDAVLNLGVSHLLMQRFPLMKEGDLSQMRSGLVSESRLAECARSLDLGSHLLLGKGEAQSNGSAKPSILADAFEAVVAAVYLDGGFNAALRLIENCFLDLIEGSAPVFALDAKSRLQEIAQQNQRKAPSYSVLWESGPDHDKRFRVRVEVFGITAEGTGRSKKTAEQDAAANALKTFGFDPAGTSQKS